MARHVIRTKNFAADAADFILDEAHKSLGERNEFRIALSGGNTPVPIYTRLALIGHDLPWELARIIFVDESRLPPRSTLFPYTTLCRSWPRPAPGAGSA